ncbi:peptidoglycan DD-metalloendopeptidase family protein [Pelagibacteraceae bacterium]|jgi:murein DD-endopeptidase MepM/ murein hydrolase activator NlpD|nr:peptidoglycan DD-metalloendopeptidase family protein [Pelagibacteraceae bacterium]MDC0952867.1 peptidoglycan DD-metalloendopeptidase family protein [Pelagibacteraceae bacterium]
MAITRIIHNFYKKKINFLSKIKINRLRFWSFNPFIFSSFIVLVAILFFSISSLVNQKSKVSKNNLTDIASSNEFSNLIEYFISKVNSPYGEINYIITNNDTVEKILKKYNVRNEDIKNISTKLKEKKLSNIYSGRKLYLIYKKLENNSNTVINLIYPISNTKSVEIRKTKKKFLVTENVLQLYKKEVVVRNIITNNLYSSAIAVGVEPNIIVEFARIYGFEVDFQRDIRKGDWFEILYEKFEDDNGKVRDTGKIIYASMYVNGEEINLYNFKYKKEEEYYDIKGKSITKSLMKTPINGARLSSSYGMRKHPILGYNKMHRGTDFAAPSGTPIMASGSGTITRARWCGGGGNCVKIKHNSTYETIYAHMKAFAKGIKEGRKIKQGQIIGYVGSTGMSTGPHLHYEVVVNGKKVNSQRLKLPSGKTLKGKSREMFELERIKIDLRLSALR